MTVREYLTLKGFKFTVVKREDGYEAVMNCPFCDDTENHFAINLKTGYFNCLRKNECGVSGNWYEFQRKLKDNPLHLNKEIAKIDSSQKKYVLPDITIKEPEGEVLQWLYKRKITDKTIKKLKLGMRDDYTLAIPYFENGELVNVKYRNIIEKHKMSSISGAKRPLYNKDNIQSFDFLIITEGEMDVAAFNEYGFNAVSVPSGCSDLTWIELDWEWLDKFSLIYLCFDNDKAGREATQKVANRLGRERCRIIEIPMKDINECLINDVPADTIISLITDARDCPPTIFSTLEQHKEEVINKIQNNLDVYGIPTPFNKLNDILRGWRREEVTVWCGMNGAGKSTLLNQIAIDLAEKGHRTCIATLEMTAERLIRWIVRQYTKKIEIDASDVKTAINALNDYIYIIDAYGEVKQEELIDNFKYAVKRYGVNTFIIDSIMRIQFSNEDELREQKDFMSRLISFAKDYRCHIHLITHPRKGLTDDRIPDKVDIYGTSHIANLATNVIILWRADDKWKVKRRLDKGKDVDAVLFIKKNKEWGDEGIVELAFDRDTKYFKEA
ncbi:AAA family ATPase [Patescibacteria group bacterium]|nr:AAA family ATPase [Patescibacteria group bacterium]